MAIYQLDAHIPQVADSAWVADNAQVMGAVHIAADASVWFGAVLRGDNEWIEVANWVYKNWDICGGLSFLPREDTVYKLAPYESIDEKKYKELAKRMEHVDYSKIITYEKQNETDLKLRRFLADKFLVRGTPNEECDRSHKPT